MRGGGEGDRTYQYEWNGCYSGGVERKIYESTEREGAGDGWPLPRQGGTAARTALPAQPKRRSTVELRPQS